MGTTRGLPFYRYLKLLKATRKRKKSQEGLRSHLGIELGTSHPRTEGRALTIFANPSFCSFPGDTRAIYTRRKHIKLLSYIDGHLIFSDHT